jgi:glutamate racemase
MFTIPIVGMEPGVKPAVSVTKTGTIGIMATKETLKSSKFNTLISQFCGEVKITTQDCPGLVEQIEKNDFSGEVTRELVGRYVLSLLEKGADTIVLGCTHFLFVAPIIEEIIGQKVILIDTGVAVAREVRRRLEASGLLTAGDREGSERFWTSGAKGDTQRVICHLWNREAIVEILPEA